MENHVNFIGQLFGARCTVEHLPRQPAPVRLLLKRQFELPLWLLKPDSTELHEVPLEALAVFGSLEALQANLRVMEVPLKCCIQVSSLCFILEGLHHLLQHPDELQVQIRRVQGMPIAALLLNPRLQLPLVRLEMVLPAGSSSPAPSGQAAKP